MFNMDYLNLPNNSYEDGTIVFLVLKKKKTKEIK